MKKIFIGIDVSKEKIDASVMMRQENVEMVLRLGHEVFENCPRGFLRMLQWTKRLAKVTLTIENALFCCETTGGYDLKLCDYLHAHDLFIWRENAIQLKRSMGLRRGKNDVADAWAIAEYALRHVDKAVLFNPMSLEVKELKTLVNYRTVLVQKKTAAKVRISEIEATMVEKHHALRFIINDAKKEIRGLEKRIKQCEDEIKQLIEESTELKKNYEHATSITGIGLVNAAALIAYTNNFTNFQTANELATYMGLAAFRVQSGTSVDRAVKVNYYANRQLKSYITQAAECAIRHDARMATYYARLIAKGKHKGIALNNVKNKLVHILFSLVKHDCDYETNHEDKLNFKKKRA